MRSSSHAYLGNEAPMHTPNPDIKKIVSIRVSNTQVKHVSCFRYSSVVMFYSIRRPRQLRSVLPPVVGWG